MWVVLEYNNSSLVSKPVLPELVRMKWAAAEDVEPVSRLFRELV